MCDGLLWRFIVCLSTRAIMFRRVYSQVGCFVEAIDAYGAVGSDTATTRVLPIELSAAQLLNVSQLKTSSAIESGDADASKQVLVATTAAAAASVSSNRRTLFAESRTSSSALRSSVLASLWATYEITSVEQAEVASLLSVLVGIVDTPLEVSVEVASGSLEFLRTVKTAHQILFVYFS